MPVSRTIRLVGSDDPWEVICETPTSMVLVNRDARRREEVAALEAQLADLRQQLAARGADVGADVAAPAIGGS